jgi:hypothetical protein
LYLACGGIRDFNPQYLEYGSYYHAPNWLQDISRHWFGYKTPIAWLYLVIAGDLFLLALIVKGIKELVAYLHRR